MNKCVCDMNNADCILGQCIKFPRKGEVDEFKMISGLKMTITEIITEFVQIWILIDPSDRWS